MPEHIEKEIRANTPDPQELTELSAGQTATITAAINRGQLSLNDIVNSGTIDNPQRYFNIINYVSQGGFAQDLRNYDHAQF